MQNNPDHAIPPASAFGPGVPVATYSALPSLLDTRSIRSPHHPARGKQLAAPPGVRVLTWDQLMYKSFGMGIHNSKQLRSVLSLEIGEQPRDLESISILHNDRRRT